MSEEQKQLTVKEALEQGYEKFCYANEGFQALHDIKEANEQDFARGVEIISKEPFYAGIDADSLKELIAEDIECNWVDQTGDDTEQVFNAVKELDFTDMAKMINDKLNAIPYYRSTGIKLVP